MTFHDLLAKVGLAPKTLTEAQDLLAPTKATLDSVAALFSAAGLNLDAMLEAGPDSLKAHLDSIADAGDEAVGRAAELEAQLAAAQASEFKAEKTADTITGALTAHGITFNAETFGADLQAHINAQAQELLAASGLPAPVAHIPEGQPISGKLTDEQHLLAYEQLPEGSKERREYGVKHYDALIRAANARK